MLAKYCLWFHFEVNHCSFVRTGRKGENIKHTHTKRERERKREGKTVGTYETGAVEGTYRRFGSV